MKEVWTNSRLKTYQECPMKETLRYRMHVAPIKKASSLALGSAVHKGLETRDIDEALALLDNTNVSSQEEYDSAEKLKAMCEAMLTGYFAIYPEFEEHHPELAFELPMRMKGKNGKLRSSAKYRIAGKIDDIAVIDGETWLVEYKTAGTIDEAYINRLYVDTQISMYMMACERMGYNPVGIIYRVIRKPSIRQKKDETLEGYIERMKQDYLDRPEFYFKEERLYRTKEDLEDFEKMLYAEVKQADNACKQNIIFKHTQSCSNWSGCPYLPLCTAQANADALFEIREPNEELKGE